MKSINRFYLSEHLETNCREDVHCSYCKRKIFLLEAYYRLEKKGLNICGRCETKYLKKTEHKKYAIL